MPANALKQLASPENIDSEHNNENKLESTLDNSSRCIYNRYVDLKSSCLSDMTKCKVADGIYVSLIEEMTMQDFIAVRKLYCEKTHDNPCAECKNLISAAEEILKSVVVDLKSLSLSHLKISSYRSDKAIRRIMQLPVVVIRLCLNGPGSQKLYVTEKMKGVEYSFFPVLINRFIISRKSQVTDLNKELLQGLCQLASTEKDRSLVKYAVCRSRGLSNKQARQLYSVSNFKKLTEKVEASLHQAELIRDEVMSLASIEEKAILQSFGIAVQDSEESSESVSDSDTEELDDLKWFSSEGSTDEEEAISSLSSRESKENDLTNEIAKNDHHTVNHAPSHEQLLNILRKNNMVCPCRGSEALFSYLYRGRITSDLVWLCLLSFQQRS